MKVKMEWPEFVALAMVAVSDHFASVSGHKVSNPQFMKRNDYEPDMDAYDYPDYVEFDIEERTK